MVNMEEQDYCLSIPLDSQLVDALNGTARQLATLAGWQLCGPAVAVTKAKLALIPQMVFAIPPLRHVLKAGELVPGTSAAGQVGDMIAQWSAAALAYAWLLDPEAVDKAAIDMRVKNPDLGIALGGGRPSVTQLNTFVKRVVSRMSEYTRLVSDSTTGTASQLGDNDLPLGLSTCGLASLSAIGHLGNDALCLVQRWGTPIRVDSSTGPQPSINTARFSPRWPSSN